MNRFVEIPVTPTTPVDMNGRLTIETEKYEARYVVNLDTATVKIAVKSKLYPDIPWRHFEIPIVTFVGALGEGMVHDYKTAMHTPIRTTPSYSAKV